MNDRSQDAKQSRYRYRPVLEAYSARRLKSVKPSLIRARAQYDVASGISRAFGRTLNST
jgi:hypothetical protein